MGELGLREGGNKGARNKERGAQGGSGGGRNLEKSERGGLCRNPEGPGGVGSGASPANQGRDGTRTGRSDASSSLPVLLPPSRHTVYYARMSDFLT